jgi:hypothetical protein
MIDQFAYDKDYFLGKNIGITLNEEQIIRVFLLSDHFHLLKQLRNAKEVFIFTQPSISSFLINQLSLNNFKNIKIIEFTYSKEKNINRFLSFVFKWIDPSKTTLRLLYREKSAGRLNLAGVIIRRIIYTLFSRSAFLKMILRRLYFFYSSKSLVSRSFSEMPPRLDLLFVTSLTNTDSDLQIAIYYKKLSTSVIATVRSWDNLTSKGVLKFEPDLFLSHSPYMTLSAIKNHGLSNVQIQTSVTPSYQSKFKGKLSKPSLGKFSIAYGCMGPFMNPDEMNFIKWLIEVSNDMSPEITIVQHPKFKHDLSNLDLGKVKTICFEYLESTLYEYYQFISSQDYVISSGTTFSLDAIFVDTPLIALAFEIEVQNFWESHLRSFDYLSHTKFLFDNEEIVRVRSKSELLYFLQSEIKVQKISNAELNSSAIIGDGDYNLVNVFLSQLKSTSKSNHIS